MASRTRFSLVMLVIGCLATQLLIISVSSETEALNCISCGHDCSSLCGTKQFRSCCFNYFRKRSGEPAPRSRLRSSELQPDRFSSSGDPNLLSVVSLTETDSLLNSNNARAIVGDQDLSQNAPSSSETLVPSIHHQYLLQAGIPYRLARQQQSSFVV